MRPQRLIFFTVVMIMAIVAMMVTLNVEPGRSQQKPLVSVSIFPLYEVSRAVAGDAIEIYPIIPLGSDAHMFAPNPKQIAHISESMLFVYNGAGFETWAESLTATFPQTTRTLDMSRHVTLEHNEPEEGDQQHHHHHGAYHPHYWLNIDNMIAMAKQLDMEFSKLLPDNAKQFHANTAAYIEELEKLKSEYSHGLAECKSRTLISNHDAFGYLARANKLENISVIGLSSDEQPSAQMVAHVVKLTKHHGMKTIFFEELINDNVSQTIAKEAGAKAVPLQPLENISEDELKSHQTYISIMRENLVKLRTAMECR